MPIERVSEQDAQSSGMRGTHTENADLRSQAQQFEWRIAIKCYSIHIVVLAHFFTRTRVCTETELTLN